jgi:hypothetical protein
MAEYSFISVWQLDAPIEWVWEVIHDAAHYPDWWQYVASVEQLEPGDSRGIGALHRYRWTTALPYTFVFELRATRVEPPHLLEATAVGELAGLGRWELAADGAGTTVQYTWNVRTTKPWMNVVAPLARPAFSWNHGIIMRAGGEGLARWLGARLLRNESFASEDTPGRQVRPLVVGVALGGVLAAVAYRALRRR